MPRFSVNTPHNLAPEEALKRVHGLLDRVKEKYQGQVSDLTESWRENLLDFAFKTYTFAIKGQLKVEPGQVTIDGEIPFAAVMFKGRIEQTIRDELAKRLA